MKYLLDTCTLSYFFRKDLRIVANFKKHLAQDLCLSSITGMEIEYGLKLHQEREIKLRPTWEELKRIITVIPFGEEEASCAGSLRAYLKEKGKPIGPYDLLIGSTAKVNHLILVTSNVKEFSHIPSLKIQDWREEIL